MITGDTAIFAGWWFGCHEFYFPRNIGCLIIPIDEVIFFRGVAQPPTSLGNLHIPRDPMVKVPCGMVSDQNIFVSSLILANQRIFGG